MSLNKIKRFIKTHRNIYQVALYAKKIIIQPREVNYCKEYFKVLEFNRLNEYKEHKEKIKIILAEKLSSLLRETLCHVPYYRETVSIKADDINVDNAYTALKEFPYLSKKMIMDNKEAFLNDTFDKSSLTYGTSGGSTGEGIGVWRTENERQIESAFFDYEWGKLGFVRGKSKIVRFSTAARKRINERPWEYARDYLYISPYHLNKQWLEEIYKEIFRFRPDFFHTYPSCLEMLARYMQDQNLPPIKCGGLLLASEMFTKDQHKLFKEKFNAPICVHYGLSESSNLGFTYFDSNNDRIFYKLNPIYGYSENYQDPLGYEIVGTSYWNFAMPFIRYRTQDYGKIENGIIHKLDGRSQDFLTARDGSKIPGFTIKIDEFTWDYLSVYQIVQNKVGEIVLKVVPKSNFNQGIKELILKKQIDRWGGFFNITLEVVEKINRTGIGKHRLIVNNLESSN